MDKVAAGDICAVAGMGDVSIGDTIVDPANPTPLPAIKVEEPTVRMTFSVNTSPFAGQEGKFVVRQLSHGKGSSERCKSPLADYEHAHGYAHVDMFSSKALRHHIGSCRVVLCTPRCVGTLVKFKGSSGA